MKTVLIKTSFIFLFSLLVMACRNLAPIYNIENAPVINYSGKNYTTEQVKSAIIRAGMIRGWVIHEIRPGLLQGDIVVRNKHRVTVEISYTDKNYSIVYKSSNLPAERGRIHPKYNVWIGNLHNDIRAHLANLHTTQQ
jgi:hypothetical protein